MYIYIYVYIYIYIYIIYIYIYIYIYNVISRVVACINDIGQWMTGNRIQIRLSLSGKLNTDKTQFIWHGTRVQLSEVNIDKVELDRVSIPMSTKVRCLGVMLDGELSFAEHIKQLSNGCFYQVRQLWTIRRLLTKESAKTLVLSRIDYCNSVLNHVCAVHLRRYNPYYTLLQVLFCGYGSTIIYRLLFVMNFIGYLSAGGLNSRRVP